MICAPNSVLASDFPYFALFLNQRSSNATAVGEKPSIGLFNPVKIRGKMGKMSESVLLPHPGSDHWATGL